MWLVAFVALTACRAATSAPTAVFQTAKGPVRVSVEIVDDDASRSRGLMYRNHIDDGHGMLFVFDDVSDRAFWMKNTLIPLDMIWMDAQHRIVHIARDVQPCKADPCPSYPPNAKAVSVLELAAGVAAKHHLANGNVLRFEGLDSVVVR